MATAFPVAVLSLLVAARATAVLSNGWSSEVPFTFALFVVPTLYGVPASRRELYRYRWALLALQGAMTWACLALFGKQWQVGIGGLLAGLVLVIVRGRLSWAIAACLLLAEAVVRATVFGFEASPSWFGVIEVITFFVDDAIVVFGMVRVSQIVCEVDEARVRAVHVAAASERLEAAESLGTAVGGHLARIEANAASAQAVLSHDPDQAGALVVAAGAQAREAARQARAIPTGRQAAIPVRLASRQSPADIGARLAWAVAVTVLVMVSVVDGSQIFLLHVGARRTALVIVGMLLTVVLQLNHSRAGTRNQRPRAWQLTLAIQALLVYSFLFPFVWTEGGTLAPFLAASILLFVRGRSRWVSYGLVVVSYSVLSIVLPLHGNSIFNGTRPYLWLVLNQVAEISVISLVVYGLSRLAFLGRQLEVLQSQVVEAAAIQERLRVARDVHDLLGLGLSAIALKADLVVRLISRDEDATADLQELSRICAAAIADIRLVARDSARLRLCDELDAARAILASAGIRVPTVAPETRLPPEADDVLAPVLREAVTNVLRHSRATECLIEVVNAGDTIKLQVSNNGFENDTGRPAGVAGRGRGLDNLAARLECVNGRLRCYDVDGWFVLIAQLPFASGGPEIAGLQDDHWWAGSRWKRLVGARSKPGPTARAGVAVRDPRGPLFARLRRVRAPLRGALVKAHKSHDQQ